MRNYALDTKMLPKVWVTWASTENGSFSKRYWLNCQTGKKKTTPENWMLYENEGSMGYYGRYRDDNRTPVGIYYYNEKADKIWVRNGHTVRYAYAKYHPDIDRLELAVVGIDTTRAEEPHKWKYLGNRFFIAKDKSIITQDGKPFQGYTELYDYHSPCNGNNLIGMVIRLNIPKEFLNEFKKFVGADYFTIGNGSTITIEAPWHMQEWYKTKQKTRSAGKQQKLTDELTSYPLSDTTGFAEKYPEKQSRYGEGRWTRTLSGVVYFEKVNDEWDVLRAFYRTNGCLHEEWRIYIDKKNNSRIVSKNHNGWVPSRQVHHRWGGGCYLANAEEAIENCNRIKYILTATNDVEEVHLVDFLVTALRFSEIEQLCKFGYTKVAVDIAQSHTPKADLKDMFGGYYNDKEKTLLKKISMTKPQFDYYMDNRQSGYYHSNALSRIRTMFGDDLTYMDITSFEKYYNGMKQVCRSFWRGLTPAMESINCNETRFFKNLVRLSNKSDTVYTMAKDALYAYTGLPIGNKPEIDWYFDDVSDLIRVHDAITELKRIHDEERQARWNASAAKRREEEEKRRKKLDEKRKEYEYEDDEYIIRLPQDSNEIIREGNVQSICIGGYTSSHANGNTNLFFLRKKDTESVPFYAIEMDNNKSIVQIHGSCNRWLGCNPEAIPTVIRWLRKNGIKCSDKILTCKSTGYHSTNEYVPMPIVD